MFRAFFSRSVALLTVGVVTLFSTVAGATHYLTSEIPGGISLAEYPREAASLAWWEIPLGLLACLGVTCCLIFAAYCLEELETWWRAR